MSDRRPTKAHDASPAPCPAHRRRLVGLWPDIAPGGWLRMDGRDGKDVVMVGGGPRRHGAPAQSLRRRPWKPTRLGAPGPRPHRNLPVLVDRAPVDPRARRLPRRAPFEQTAELPGLVGQYAPGGPAIHGHLLKNLPT